MASVLHDIKEKLSTTKAAPNHPVGDSVPPPQQGGEEQRFNILPHPAVAFSNSCARGGAFNGPYQKSNDPADLQKPSEETGGLQTSQGAFGAFKSAPGPVIPNQEIVNSLPPAKTREELDSLQAQLNKG